MISDEIYHTLAKVLDRLPSGFPSTDSGIEIKIFKSASRLIICVLFILSLFNSALSEPLEKPDGSPSVFDSPDQGCYYGFVVNNSSHFIEIRIISTKINRQIYSKVVQPASLSLNETKTRHFGNREKKCECRPAHVIPLWLKLDCYKVSIRCRDDLVDEVQPGQWKSIVMVLDKKYVEESPGPFTLEIDDDHYDR